MKNIFDMDIGVENPSLDGRVFCTQQLSKELTDESEKLQSELENLYKNSKIPLIVIILQLVCILIAVACIGAIFDDMTCLVKEPLIGIVFVISAAIALVIYIWQVKETKQFQKDMETNEIDVKSEMIHQKMKEEFNIPQETKEVDVLRNVYQMKNGKRKNLWKEKGQYENVPTIFYQKENHICFVIEGAEITIPIQKIQQIEKVTKKTSIVNWTKEIDCNKEPYRKYKIEKNDLGAYWIREYYKISVDSIWGLYQFLLPSYEEEVVKHIEEWKAML